MHRAEFFKELERRMREDVLFPFSIESNEHIIDSSTTDKDDFKVCYSIEGRSFEIIDQNFDKYYYLKGFYKDIEKDTLTYKPNDMDIAIRNIKHLILDKFGEDFLYTKSTAKMRL